MTIEHPPGDTPWGFDASFLPHPVNFMWYNAYNADTSKDGVFLNPQLDGASHRDKYATFKALAQRWRLAYAGVTSYQDGPDLANQGTIVVAQPPVQMIRRNLSVPVSGHGVQVSCPVCMASDEDKPNFITSQAMPNAYFSRSREGAYVPLKLTESSQDWISETNDVAFGNLSSTSFGTTFKDLEGDINFRTTSGLYPHWPLTTEAPFLGLQPTFVQLDPLGIVTGLYGECTSEFMNGTFGQISARNLDPSTSFTFYFRYGIEMQVTPSSVLAPQMKLSPPYDAMALTSYFSIARELKDAYPANYNDLGKLWDVVSAAAKRVLPLIGSMGPVGSAAQFVGNVAIGAGDSIRSRKKKGKKAKPFKTTLRTLAAMPPPTPSRGGRDKMSAAEVEAYRTANNLARALQTATRKR